MRDRLENAILQGVPNCTRNGCRDARLPNTANIAFGFVEAEAILMMLDQLGICASSGSACTTGSVEPSHVLTAMGVSPMRARGSVRFSLGRYNTDEEVDYLLEQLPGIVAKLRAISPLDTRHPDNDKFDLVSPPRPSTAAKLGTNSRDPALTSSGPGGVNE
jgi:cysteine desulfurase